MNVTVGNGGKEVSWNNNGKIIKKTYSSALMGYEVLPDETGVILLEPLLESGPENAVIFNLDGTKRWRLPFPPNLGQGVVFDRVGISQGKLIVIGIINGRDVRFEVDHNALKYADYAASR